MKPGPPPKPTKIKRLEGNPGQYPLNENEPEPTRGCDPPSWLLPGARAEWNLQYSELDALGLLTRVDRAALTCWCVAWDKLERAALELIPTEDNPLPEVQVTESGYQTVSGAELVLRQAEKSLRAWCQEFGFSPASRSRISVEKSETSKLDALMGGNDPN